MNPNNQQYDPSFVYGGDSNETTSYYGTTGIDDDGYYNAMGVDETTTYGQQQQSWNNSVGGGGADPIGDDSTASEPGTYYQMGEIQSPFIYGAPISAVAYDMTHDAICFATDTLSSMSSSTSVSHASSTSRRGPQQRFAMLLTHQVSDGSLYSVVAGHPEAPAKVLNAIYSSIYGPTQSSIPTRTVPNHAYIPTYGKSDPALPEVVSAYIPGMVNASNCQMGVTTLVPLPSGHMASVSPAGVRVHANGGMQMADLHLEGMMALTTHPHSPTTHVSVGGVAMKGGSSSSTTNTETQKGSEQHVHCLDIWQGLRPVTSHTIDRTNPLIGVTCLATSHGRGCLAVGCSDGFLRLIDHRNRSLAKIKSHVGGVVSVAVSDDGTLVATTGYASTIPPRNPSTTPYAFSDQNILINDIRYLGRGGFPQPFSGLRGGPRFLSFLPDIDGLSTNRLLVASGQSGGGCQVVVPFDNAENVTPYFILPQLNQGESINCISVSNQMLALGTNQGRVVQHEMVGYHSRNSDSISGTISNGVFVPPSPTVPRNTLNLRDSAVSDTSKKVPLVMPPYQTVPPALSIDASILLKAESDVRIGVNDRMKSIFGAYIMTAQPSVSSLDIIRDRSQPNSFGPLSTNPAVGQCRFKVATSVFDKGSHVEDFVQTVQVSDLNVDILADHRPGGKNNHNTLNGPLLNPNKFLYNNKLFKVAYNESLNRPKRLERRGRRNARAMSDGSYNDEDTILIPRQYRLWLRPTHKSAASYSYFEYNTTGTVPGFDYSLTMQNSFVPPVLLLLYFIPEIRDAANKAQLRSVSASPKDQPLLTELGYLFYRIESISRNAYIYPVNDGVATTTTPRIDAWAPLSFVSFLSTMTEAERNQILDGSPAAVDPSRRPESFYRFMLYQLDSELSRGRSTGIVDSLTGIDFVSINEFISGSGPPTQSITRHLTVEFAYDYFFGPDNKETDKPSFGDVLQYNLFRASRLRAWSTSSKSYETIVQRKIATSLPSVLSISASCAGRKGEPGITLWQQTLPDNRHWLPETIEIEIDEDGSVIVRELIHDDKPGSDYWKVYRGSGSIPESISQLVKDCTSSDGVRKQRYRLEAVLSMVRDDMDRACPEEVRAMDFDGPFGHQVLQIRVQHDMKKRIIEQQRNALQSFLSTDPVENDLTFAGRDANRELFQKRLEDAKQRLTAKGEHTSDQNEIDPGNWIIVNGFVVSDTDIHDVQTFDVRYKEPLLVVFRAIDSITDVKETSKHRHSKQSESSTTNLFDQISVDVLRTLSITNNTKSPYHANQRNSVLPGKGDIVAFDAEFVAVAEEASAMTASGSKLTIRETRHAIARISVVDGRSDGTTGRRGSIILDDHVQPIEPIVDYLTRFSGIVEQDLSSKHSKHHLISNRTSYLKLRCLIERGCIFVGHGLQQDFWIANLVVPAHQIIDTVDIYHKPAQRFISLRFLTNFILKHDVQQDVHDSVEDAMAAFELYRKAIELKENGTFEQVLNDLYEYGQKNDWKLGVDDDDDENNDDRNDNSKESIVER